VVAASVSVPLEAEQEVRATPTTANAAMDVRSRDRIDGSLLFPAGCGYVL
jgi:hypothetical protein